MKTRHFFIVSTFILCSFAQTVFASVDICVLNREVISAVAQGVVHIRVNDAGVVTLHGRVDSILDSAHAERAALKIDGVTQVRNYIFVLD